MECPADVKDLLNSLADHAWCCRVINKLLNDKFEQYRIDTTTDEFINAFAYVEGDCDTTVILEHIKEL